MPHGSPFWTRCPSASALQAGLPAGQPCGTRTAVPPKTASPQGAGPASPRPALHTSLSPVLPEPNVWSRPTKVPMGRLMTSVSPRGHAAAEPVLTNPQTCRLGLRTSEQTETRSAEASGRERFVLSRVTLQTSRVAGREGPRLASHPGRAQRVTLSGSALATGRQARGGRGRGPPPCAHLATRHASLRECPGKVPRALTSQTQNRERLTEATQSTTGRAYDPTNPGPSQGGRSAWEWGRANQVVVYTVSRTHHRAPAILSETTARLPALRASSGRQDEGTSGPLLPALRLLLCQPAEPWPVSQGPDPGKKRSQCWLPPRRPWTPHKQCAPQTCIPREELH